MEISLRMMGSVYGESAQEAFFALWWTKGSATKSRRGMQTVREDNRHSALRRSSRDRFEQIASVEEEVLRDLEEEI